MPELSHAAPGEVDRRVRELLADAVVVLLWFVVIAVLGAVVWWQLTPLAEFTRTSTQAEMGEAQLGKQVAADGWYFTVAAVGGLVSGIVLLWLRRRRDPIAMVVLVVLGAVLASWVMARVGLWLGPGSPKEALAHVPVGGTVPTRLETHADGVRFAWPVAAMVGALVILWGLDESRHATPGPGVRRAEPPMTTAHGAAIQRLIDETRLTPVRLRPGYAVGDVDKLLEHILAVADNGTHVVSLLDRTPLAHVRLREAYDADEVDQLLARVRAVAAPAITG